jgi:hypothetical protein
MTNAFDYSEARDDADELIEEFGQAVSVRRNTAGGTPSEPTLTPVDTATKAARVEFTRQQIARGNIELNDERWLVAAGSIVALGLLAPPDALVVAGAVKPIIRVVPLSPAGTIVMFDCQCRA